MVQGAKPGNNIAQMATGKVVMGQGQQMPTKPRGKINADTVTQVHHHP